MRLALQRLLASPPAGSVTRSAVHSNGDGFCQRYSPPTPTQGQSRRYAAKKNGREQPPGSEPRTFQIRKVPSVTKADRQAEGAIERNWPDVPKARARLPDAPIFDGVEGAGLSRSTVQPDLPMLPGTQHDLRSGNLSSRIQSRLPIEAERDTESWRSRLVTLEQYQYESNLEAPAVHGPRLVDDPSHARDWELWLELIVFRKRHHGAEGTVAVYIEIFRRDLRLPTLGNVANQLWDLLIRAGFYDSRLLEDIVTYALSLKRSTGRSWLGMYHGIVSVVLKKEPDSAYRWHLKLRNDFPPSLGDYKRIFKLSLGWGSSGHFQGLYRDHPIPGMYRTVVWHLCMLQMYDEVLKWNDLLYDARDFPMRFTDIKPLLDHLAYIGDGPRLETIVRALSEAKVGVSNVAENFVRRDAAISREILNRQLGEVHGVGPKHLSDSFCARLFATRLFSVDTVISGLQMVAAETIGPLSLREIAVRDNCDPGAICHHTDRLKSAGISLDSTVFCTLVRGLAMENKRGILKSVVDCDLHPDTFGDVDLQERLLAQYCEENDLMKIERTLAVLTAGCEVKELQMVRMNLILRCQITLGRRKKVLATLEELKRLGIPLSARSSRHLRVCWLSRRQVGRGADGTQELAILIQASRMTMQSGHFVPIIAWREILRRLGMAGRLTEFENLALWLVDWYSSPAAKAALPKRLLFSGHGGQTLIEGAVSPEKSANRDPQRLFNTLFTTAARHAIVAWGFQHIMKSRRKSRRSREASTVEDVPRFRWTWGLHLLYKLRKRGVPIGKDEIARICRHRLNTLFGTGLSKRKINRRARSEQRTLVSYTESVYIQKMEEIWGKGFFRVWRHVGRNVEERIGRKPRDKWRIKRAEYRTRSDDLGTV
ncbi:hypothetical protein HO133_010460 [Letharia lupina]|uniref:Pentatricopeptide repeat domain-containing protein n=1 Tax=Letharia lupina TaxID=560253 RepID=A0A8H6CKR1_9LECA|nr:uncharacterized protein HO133_010460 [Letharia lupina]KAF6225263.1 hypothetical protein HO133_010460 [Letharia lupina]